MKNTVMKQPHCFLCAARQCRPGVFTMRYTMAIIGMVLTLSACPHWFAEPYPDLIETEKQTVADCRLIGMVSEAADASNPFPVAAEANMVLRVRERAGQMGATHIVWLHKTGTMAAAEAYRCRPE